VEVSDTVLASDVVAKVGSVAVYDYAIPEYALIAYRSKVLFDGVKILDALSKLVAGSVRESVTSRDGFSVSAHFVRAFVDSGAVADMLVKAPLKVGREATSVVDSVSRAVHFRRSLADSGRAVDALSRLSAKVVADSLKLTDLARVSAFFVRTLVDAGVLLDRLSKEGAKLVRDIGRATDALSKTSMVVVLDACRGIDSLVRHSTKAWRESLIPRDSVFRALVKNVYDAVVPEYVLSTVRGKVLSDVARALDRATKEPSIRLPDTVLATDWVGRGIPLRVYDATVASDYVSRSTLRSVLDVVVPEYLASKEPRRAVSDVVLSLDRVAKLVASTVADAVKALDRVARSALKSLLDASTALDSVSIVRLVVTILRDYVVPEYLTRKEPLKVLREAGRAIDEILKWIVEVYGYRLEKPLLGEVIRASHFNDPLNLIHRVKEGTKELWSSITSEPYPSSLSDLESVLSKLSPVSSGDEVRAMHVNYMMEACAHLYRFVRDTYHKYRDATGESIPEVESLLSEAYDIVSNPMLVMTGDLIMPEHFLQFHLALIYIRATYEELRKRI